MHRISRVDHNETCFKKDKSGEVGQRNTSRTHNSKSQCIISGKGNGMKNGVNYIYIYCAFILLVGITYVIGQIYCFGDQYVGKQWFYELISWDDRMNTSNEFIEH